MKRITSQIHDFWFILPEKFRFIIVGGFNSLISFLIFVYILHVLIIYYKNGMTNLYNWIRNSSPFLTIITFRTFVRQISLALAWFLSSFVSFSTQRLLVFRARGNMNIFQQYFRCLSTWFVGYLVNVFVLEILATSFEKVNLLPPIVETDIAQAFALVLSAVVTYVLLKYFAFKNKKAGCSLENEYMEII